MRPTEVLSKLKLRSKEGYRRFIETQQVRLGSNIDGLPLLAFLGLLCGVFSGGIIIAFRWILESNPTGLLPEGNAEGFEFLNPLDRFLLCVIGGILIGLILHLLKAKSRSVGVVHVLERLDYHQGSLPVRNALTQFVTASIALVSGQSVGKEGPAVHLGAAGGSWLGRLLSIPNNGVRILAASGIAAAIAAAFDTPLAGVIFAMEVIIMEYTVIGFAPVILAAVSATMLTRLTFGSSAGFLVPEITDVAVSQLPMFAIMGATIGILAAGFIQTTMLTSTVFSKYPIWLRTTSAGFITGLVAFYLPAVMGTSYDTVADFLSDAPTMGVVVIILFLFAKMFTSSTAIGLGVPAGLIGPSVVIGAAAGAAAGILTSSIWPEYHHVSLYTVLGMAAMMAATLQAPLAALIYLLELTSNQAIILPGMITVISAYLVTRVVFGKSSIYRHLMLAKGLDYRNSPLAKALRRVGVASVMDRNILQRTRYLSKEDALDILRLEPRWILLVSAKEKDARRASLIPATDLARFLNQSDSQADIAELDKIDIAKIPAKRVETSNVTMIATLQEALETMNSEQCDALYITGAHGASKDKIFGVITREHIESSYRV
ncbi:MAG: chloride channel protein [Gammaproteobacteria bacterium]|nr:chloride channel protein [Gammaproteobacteria bacterium]